MAREKAPLPNVAPAADTGLVTPATVPNSMAVAHTDDITLLKNDFFNFAPPFERWLHGITVACGRT